MFIVLLIIYVEVSFDMSCGKINEANSMCYPQYSYEYLKIPDLFYTPLKSKYALRLSISTHLDYNFRRSRVAVTVVLALRIKDKEQPRRSLRRKPTYRQIEGL